MDPKHGYLGEPKRPLSSEQYGIVLTALNTVNTIAITSKDIELFRASNDQLHRLADEMHAAGYQETWHVDTQSYTVDKKQ